MSLVNTSSQTQPAITDALSADAGRRGIELAFVQRIDALMRRSSLLRLESAQRATFTTEAAATQNRLTDKVYAVMARDLERGVPAQQGFGRFREQ